MSKIFDFHVHTSFKAFNSKGENENIPDFDLWKERCKNEKDRVWAVRTAHGELNYSSQAHLDALSKANIKCVCTSIYPLERGFTRLLEKINSTKLTEIIFSIIVFVLNKKELALKIISYISGFDKERVRKINNDELQYYPLLESEYKFLQDVQRNHNKNPEFKLIRNFSDMEEGKICKIITVEGAQSFFSAPMNNGRVINMKPHDEHENQDFKKFIDTALKNIGEAKKWQYAPFIVTFCHHFYNHLAGHAPSFAGFIKFALFQEGTVKLNSKDTSSYYSHVKKGDRVDYFKLGIRESGWLLINEFLRKSENQRRILIDTKHMSAHARIQYHEYIKNHNSQYPDDKIPIIKTHTAVAGRAKMEEGIYKPIDESTSYDWFNSGSINLFDDEIVDIIDSDGLMGIMLDEKRISTKAVPRDVEANSSNNNYKKFKKAKKKIKNLNQKIKSIECGYSRDKKNKIQKLKREIRNYINQVKPYFLSMLYNQFFHIVFAYAGDNKDKGQRAWQHIAIGTDYDGLINPVDLYFQSDELVNFEADLVGHFQNYKNVRTAYGKTYNELLFGQDIKKIIDDILWNNAMIFLQKYYNDKYLLK